jgi:hypothetical protein
MRIHSTSNHLDPWSYIHNGYISAPPSGAKEPPKSLTPMEFARKLDEAIESRPEPTRAGLRAAAGILASAAGAHNLGAYMLARSVTGMVKDHLPTAGKLGEE